MRSEISKTSGIEWLINTIPIPLSLTRRTRFNTFFFCTTPSAAVGSSKNKTLLAQAADLATAILCL